MTVIEHTPCPDGLTPRLPDGRVEPHPTRPYLLPPDVARRHPTGEQVFHALGQRDVVVLLVDRDLPNAWLDRMNALPTITVISTCVGYPGISGADVTALVPDDPSAVVQGPVPTETNVSLSLQWRLCGRHHAWYLTLTARRRPAADWFPSVLTYLEALDRRWQREGRQAPSNYFSFPSCGMRWQPAPAEDPTEDVR
jgi:hypothetical protein